MALPAPPDHSAVLKSKISRTFGSEAEDRVYWYRSGAATVNKIVTYDEQRCQLRMAMGATCFFKALFTTLGLIAKK